MLSRVNRLLPNTRSYIRFFQQNFASGQVSDEYIRQQMLLMQQRGKETIYGQVSDEYLRQQVLLMQQRGKEATIVALNKGHLLVGPDATDEFVLKDIAWYEPTTLLHLSAGESDAIRAACQRNWAGFAYGRLRVNIQCVQVKTAAGHPYYYMHPFKAELDMKSLQKFDAFVQQIKSQDTHDNSPQP